MCFHGNGLCPALVLFFTSNRWEENVTVVTQQMQHMCLTAEPRPTPLSGLFNLQVCSVVKFMVSLNGETG